MRQLWFLPLLLPLSAFASDDYLLVDLTHEYNADTIYWPTSPTHFELDSLYAGTTEGGWYYSANSFCTPEHGGTHLDAPIHFNADKQTVEKIPLETLVGPGVVIDVSEQSTQDRNYRLTKDDVLEHERQHGVIPTGAIVLLRTGWSKYWPDVQAYLGDDTPGDATKLSFPSYGEDATRYLIEERNVAILGVDTASIDYGASKDFIVHRVAAAANMPGLESLTNLEELPPIGFTVVALPMKIEGGSGSPVRVIALIPR
ncbi:MAG: cyclase family protein [Gammaproteobacteria bacterium]